MKRILLMFSAAAAFLVPAAAPMTVLAQSRPEARADSRPRVERRAPSSQRSQTQRERGDMAVSPRARQDGPRRTPPAQTRPQARPESRPEARPEARPDRPRPQRPTPDAQRPNRPEANRPGQGRPSRPDQPRPNRPEQNRPNRPDGNRPGRPDAHRPNRPNTNRPDQHRPDRPGANRPDWNRPGDHRPNARPNRPDRPGQWNRDRDYREFHNRWNRDQWRRDWDRRHRSDWWRHDPRFRGWSGVRVGFYFAPGYGYYSVPRTYWNRQYYVGQYLPDIFWRYQVNDWRTYGLGYPPPGTRWVYVDNAIYLIDQYDGYIIEVVRDAWRW